MRFAVSPTWEAIRSLVALQDPSTAALHVPWLRSLSGRLGAIALEPVLALIPPRGDMPDFLTPPPSTPLGRIDDDLGVLRRTPVRQIRHDIERVEDGVPHRVDKARLGKARTGCERFDVHRMSLPRRPS